MRWHYLCSDWCINRRAGFRWSVRRVVRMQVRLISLRALIAAPSPANPPPDARFPPLGLSRMMKGERRVDVDELIVLAAILGVTPVALLALAAAGVPEVPQHRALARLRGQTK